MILYDQLHLSDKEAGTHGDCFAACVKTVLQNPLDALPHPIGEDGDWNPDFFKGLEDRYGFVRRYQPLYDEKDLSGFPDIVIASGPTIRTEQSGAIHAVVWNLREMKMIHDPHPSRAGITEMRGFYFLKERDGA